MPIKIRNYSDSDYDTLVSLVDEFNNYIVSIDTRGVVKKFDNLGSAQDYTGQLLQDARDRGGFVYILESNQSEIVGFVQGIIDKNNSDLLYRLTHIPFSDGWVGELYVRPEYRGLGFGKMLLQKAENYFKNNGCRYVRVLVLSDNRDSVAFYKKYGLETRDLEMAKEIT